MGSADTSCPHTPRLAHSRDAEPDPAIFRIALERIGATAENALYLGDVPSVDVEGARSAGIAPVLLDRHDLYPDVDAPRVQSFEEFESWLSGPN